MHDLFTELSDDEEKSNQVKCAIKRDFVALEKNWCNNWDSHPSSDLNQLLRHAK